MKKVRKSSAVVLITFHPNEQPLKQVTLLDEDEFT